MDQTPDTQTCHLFTDEKDAVSQFKDTYRILSFLLSYLIARDLQHWALLDSQHITDSCRMRNLSRIKEDSRNSMLFFESALLSVMQRKCQILSTIGIHYPPSTFQFTASPRTHPPPPNYGQFLAPLPSHLVGHLLIISSYQVPICNNSSLPS